MAHITDPELKKMMKAQGMIRLSIKKGYLIRPDTCSQCGKHHKRIEAHHDDYNKPLEIRFLCIRCHQAFHSYERQKWRNKK